MQIHHKVQYLQGHRENRLSYNKINKIGSLRLVPGQFPEISCILYKTLHETVSAGLIMHRVFPITARDNSFGGCKFCPYVYRYRLGNVALDL